MRTLEEIYTQGYTNLTYEEFVEHDLSCEEYCPFYGDYCSGGISCYGGSPIEPICTSFDLKDSLEDKYNEFNGSMLKHELWEDELIIKRELKEKQQEIRKQKLKEYRTRNFNELNKIKKLNKQIKDINKAIKRQNALILFANSINTVNKIFRESNANCPSDISISNNEYMKQEMLDKIYNIKNEVIEIKNTIKLNEKHRKGNI